MERGERISIVILARTRMKRGRRETRTRVRRLARLVVSFRGERAHRWSGRRSRRRSVSRSRLPWRVANFVAKRIPRLHKGETGLMAARDLYAPARSR